MSRHLMCDGLGELLDILLLLVAQTHEGAANGTSYLGKLYKRTVIKEFSLLKFLY